MPAAGDRLADIAGEWLAARVAASDSTPGHDGIGNTRMQCPLRWHEERLVSQMEAIPCLLSSGETERLLAPAKAHSSFRRETGVVPVEPEEEPWAGLP